MHKFIATLVGALLLAAALVGASPATAGASSVSTTGSVTTSVEAQAKRGIATRREFRKVRKGMTMQRVSRIFGIGGRQVSYSSGCCGGAVPAYQLREYNAGRFSYVSVSYERRNGTWRVESKNGYWF